MVLYSLFHSLQLINGKLSHCYNYLVYFRFVTIADAPPFGISLIYGAPNYNTEGNAQIGQVFIANLSSVLSQENVFDKKLEDFSYDVIGGAERMGKFGWDAVLVDINKDGVNDIAISAPSQGIFLHKAPRYEQIVNGIIR